mmetsp:Transcript_37145/g.90292  ORF Transcript_37145/g.90292 Transcript_37145/m.90292 type:complete len:142 (-) Transcript_37145:48-473(-)|eukprot:CAMPEP_0113629382 /NCGR_PEP_ID=MMETSP0017_2-20120614/15250_1 /TAXON_ID=2856 /ORGANISM="Cylindrotheca closterium" /LENGTH=141 /DNA_ID=CAMNT_0000539773 /DNA_START=56 /DNA_END=481 /DNA_ORIENTATION=- /assembly_acc=CAM_ASM_000147
MSNQEASVPPAAAAATIFSSPPAASAAAPRNPGAAENTGSATVTMTVTETPAQNDNNEVLELTLRPRANVSWNESVIDNEGMGKKSSKRCCIWHKQREFGESSTESDGSSSSGGPSNGQKKIARKKKGGKKKLPDYQRFHA